MKRFHFTPDFKIILCIFLLLSIGSCREEEGSDKKENAGYGTIPLNIIWQSTPTKEKQVAGYPTAIEESDASSADKISAKAASPKNLGHIIRKMKITISAADMPDIVAIFNYNDHSGTIHNVPVGTGRKITCEGLDLKSYARYKGERTGIEVVKGENSPVDIEVKKRNIEVIAGGDKYNTIQSAIDAADNNDIIEVFDGEYKENIIFSDKSITVRSINGPDRVSIGNAGFSSLKSIVTFNEIPPATSIILDGFTIRKGYARNGGGIYFNNSSPKINNCIISENRTMRGKGGGVACYNGSSPELTNCIIKSNTGSVYGGGIYCEQSSLTISNCNINNNEAYAVGGINIEDNSDIKIINCNISGNKTTDDKTEDSTIVCKDSTATLINSIIAKNMGEGDDARGIYMSYTKGEVTNSMEIINCNIVSNYANGIILAADEKYNDSSKNILTVVNSIIWGNYWDSIIYSSSLSDIAQVSYSNVQVQGEKVWGTTEDNNINTNPKFANKIYYCLHEDSPCIDTGTNDKEAHPDLPEDDKYGRKRGVPDDMEYDMGVDEYGTTNIQVFVPTDYSTIQAAINAAPPYLSEVIVGPGRYNENINFLGKAITVRSEKGPEETTIDGGNSYGSVVTVGTGESDSSIFSGFKIVNGFSFIGGGGISVNKNSTPKISDSIICSNLADTGGGIFANDHSSPTITNCTIKDNIAGLGGGIYVYDNSSLTISDNVISSNEANTYGGGIYLSNNSWLTISNNVISSNEASNGGGIYLSNNSWTTISNSVISSNEASNGGGVYLSNNSWTTISNSVISSNEASNGGGVYLSDYSWLTINNSVISSNNADVNGGGISSAEFSDGDLETNNCTISNNKSGVNGGGIYYYYSWNVQARFNNCIISNNSTSSYGGGVYCYWTPAKFSNCIISNNLAFIGGGVYLAGESEPRIENCTISSNKASSGGGIAAYHVDLDIINCMITGNSATSEGGGYLCGSSGSLAEAVMTNCSISGNSAGSNGGGIVCVFGGPVLRVYNSILWGNTVGNTAEGIPNEIHLPHASSIITVSYSVIDPSHITGATTPSLNDNITYDPLFVGGGDYHLKSGSTCINAGTLSGAPEYDIDGDPRVSSVGGDDMPDIGADEYYPPP
jgi:parallel beta-helix repeat protein